MMGLRSHSGQVFIIDFGLAKRYRDPETHVHIPYTDGKSLTGTARYASVAALAGIEPSRRDDMESLGYVWVYLLRGSLPWIGGARVDRRDKFQKILEAKRQTNAEDLCAGLPDEFAAYFHRIRRLRFADEPAYAEYRAMFRGLLIGQGFTYDGIFDWTQERRPDGECVVAATGSSAAAQASRDGEWDLSGTCPPGRARDGAQHRAGRVQQAARRRTFRHGAETGLTDAKSSSQDPIRVTMGARDMLTFPRQRPAPFPVGLNVRHKDKK
jgi:hypothetical protein